MDSAAQISHARNKSHRAREIAFHDRAPSAIAEFNESRIKNKKRKEKKRKERKEKKEARQFKNPANWEPTVSRSHR